MRTSQQERTIARRAYLVGVRDGYEAASLRPEDYDDEIENDEPTIDGPVATSPSQRDDDCVDEDDDECVDDEDSEDCEDDDSDCVEDEDDDLDGADEDDDE